MAENLQDCTRSDRPQRSNIHHSTTHSLSSSTFIPSQRMNKRERRSHHGASDALPPSVPSLLVLAASAAAAAALFTHSSVTTLNPTATAVGDGRNEASESPYERTSRPLFGAEARRSKGRKSGPTLSMPPFIRHRHSAFSSDEANAEDVRQWYNSEKARRAADEAKAKADGGGVAAAAAENGDGLAANGGDTSGLGLLSSYNTRLGRRNINSRDAFWRAGWQPVPMHSVGLAAANREQKQRKGEDALSDAEGGRVPFAHGAMEHYPVEPKGLSMRAATFLPPAMSLESEPAEVGLLAAASSSSKGNSLSTPFSAANRRTYINLTSYSYEVPRGHKVFMHISPNVDDLPSRHDDGGASASRLYGPTSRGRTTVAVAESDEALALAERWGGLCSAKTDSDWCFITIGCWGSGNIATQSRVARAMDTVLTKYVGRDLFPLRGKGGGAEGYEGGAPPSPLKKQQQHQDELIRPCDIRFGTINGDNFYQSGILRADTSRLVSGFEVIYGSPALAAMPWFVSHGNHDYRGDWFQQTALMNRPVTERWGRVGHAGPGDREVGDWVAGMNADTVLASPLPDPANADASANANPPLRPLRTADVALLGGEQSFSTGRWYLPHPYYSARVSKELVLITLDCPLLERCHNNGDASDRCWDGGQQRGWLASLLATLDYDPHLRYRVIQCHYPLYANGPHVNHQWLIDFIEPLMVAHGVQLYVNADNHYLQVSKKTAANGFGGGSGGSAAAAADYFFVNSGGGGGYGLNHHRTDKNYAANPHNVFDEIRNGPFFHCIRGAGTPAERLVTIAYNDDGEKLYEFSVRPFVSPIALRLHEERVKVGAEAEVEVKKAGGANGANGGEDGGGNVKEALSGGASVGLLGQGDASADDDPAAKRRKLFSEPSSPSAVLGGSSVFIICCCFAIFGFAVTRRIRRPPPARPPLSPPATIVPNGGVAWQGAQAQQRFSV